MSNPELDEALASDDAYLVFRNPAGELRDFSVNTLWKESAEAKHHLRDGTMGSRCVRQEVWAGQAPRVLELDNDSGHARRLLVSRIKRS